MARGRYIDTSASPQNIRALWDQLHHMNQQFTAQQDTITAQAATIAALQGQLGQVSAQAQQALITAGKSVEATQTTIPPDGGGGEVPPSDHPSHYDVVVAVIADLVARGEDLSGPCGSFSVVNEVVRWLRPSEPDVGIIHKPTGTNCNSYSIDALMYLDGAVFDILIDADNAPATGAAPQWGYAGTRPASDWRDPV